MTELLDLDVQFVESLDMTHKMSDAKSTIFAEQDKEKQRQLLDYVSNTIEEIQEFMEWEEKILSANMGQPKKNY